MHPSPELTRTGVVTAGRAVCVALIAGAALPTARVLSGRPGTSWVWLAATLVVAGAVVVTRTPLERLADRVAYGPGGDPYAVLTGFVQRIADSLAVDDVLPHVARTVTQATRSDRGEVRLWLADGDRWRQSWPPNAPAGGPEDVDVALHHHGLQVGEIGLATTDGGLSAEDRDLLGRLAGTAGLALANVRLTYDLRRRIAESMDLAASLERSQARLVDAAAQQIRRFAARVDAAVLARLDVTEAALDRVRDGDPRGVEEAHREATAALAALRELAAGVFPPALAERGLGHALEAYALRFPDGVSVDCRTAGRAPLTVEAAAYFCAVQLLDDAASSGTVRMELRQDEDRVALAAEVTGALGTDTVQLVTDRGQATEAELAWGPAPVRTVRITWRLAGPVGQPAGDPDAAGAGR